MKRPRRMPATVEPAPVMVQSAYLLPAPRPNDTSWIIPIEVLQALPTGSAMKGLIAERRERGDWPLPEARVYAFKDRFYGEVYFSGANRHSLFYPLDVWPFALKVGGETRA